MICSVKEVAFLIVTYVNIDGEIYQGTEEGEFILEEQNG